MPQLLNRDEPLLLPLAHDALAARLIERAGFSAYAIGGFPLAAARHALPDIGLVGTALLLPSRAHLSEHRLHALGN